MATHTLHSGDIAVLVWTMDEQTPFGQRHHELRYEFSHKQLGQMLFTRLGRPRRELRGPEGPAQRFSRLIVLVVGAIRTGLWCGRLPMTTELVLRRLGNAVKSLPPVAREEVSAKSIATLAALQRETHRFSAAQLEEIAAMIEVIGTRSSSTPPESL